MKRPAYHVTAIFTTNPDDSVDLSVDDVKGGVIARLSGEGFYATTAGYPVRTVDVDVMVEAIEVDGEPDGYTTLIQSLTGLQTFHSDGDSAEDMAATAALGEAIELLRTHALPEEHPLAIR